MTTSQILSLARNKLLEQGTEIISDETILIYANLAYQDVARRIFPASSILSATVNFTAGVGTLPANFGTLYGDTYVNGRSYQEQSIADFSNASSNALVVEGGTLKVYPTTTASLSIKYYPSFPDLTTLVNPTINSYFHELIVYGILYRAYEDLQDEPLSKYYRDKYEAELNQKISVQSSYEEDNVRGGQMFTDQRLIDGGYGGFSSSPDYF